MEEMTLPRWLFKIKGLDKLTEDQREILTEVIFAINLGLKLFLLDKI